MIFFQQKNLRSKMLQRPKQKRMKKIITFQDKNYFFFRYS